MTPVCIAPLELEVEEGDAVAEEAIVVLPPATPDVKGMLVAELAPEKATLVLVGLGVCVGDAGFSTLFGGLSVG